MSRSNISYLLRRGAEHFIASIGAIAISAVLLVSVHAHAMTRVSAKPSVTILVPSVTIEQLGG